MPRLEKFDNGKNKNIKNLIIASVIILVLISAFVIYKSYALYKVEKQYDVIKAKIGDFRNLETVYFLNNEKIEELPVDNKYNFESINCTNGVTAQWDMEKSQLTNIDYNGNRNANCTINFSTACSDNTKDINSICKRANMLHTETCLVNNSTGYCMASGQKYNSPIIYGNYGAKDTFTSGDAFDCDVNGDGVYDSEKERFYYVSDYYNTTTKSFEDDTAVLIYYNNVSGEAPSNAATYAYDAGNVSYRGPVTAMVQLPTTTQWSKLSLKNETRAILNENGENIINATGKHLPTISYAGYAARLITVQEINKACNITIGSAKAGELDKCNYLMENTIYSNSNISNYGYWTETPWNDSGNRAFAIYSSHRNITPYITSYATPMGVRPVIEVSKDEIDRLYVFKNGTINNYKLVDGAYGNAHNFTISNTISYNGAQNSYIYLDKEIKNNYKSLKLKMKAKSSGVSFSAVRVGVRPTYDSDGSDSYTNWFIPNDWYKMEQIVNSSTNDSDYRIVTIDLTNITAPTYYLYMHAAGANIQISEIWFE